MVIEVQEPNDEQTSEVGWLLRSLGGESPGVFTEKIGTGPPLDHDFLRTVSCCMKVWGFKLPAVLSL